MTFHLSAQQRTRLEKSKTFAEALGVLKEAAGSLDALGTVLGTERQTIIRWQQGTWPRSAYVAKLRELGMPVKLLQPSKEIQKRLLRAEAELERIRELLR